MKNLFLSGAKGFIGRHFHKALNKYCVDAPLRSELELSDCDAMEGYFKEKKFEYLVNAASIGGRRESSIDMAQCCYENIKSFDNLFVRAKHLKRFIQLGSGAEYTKPFYRGSVREIDIGRKIPSDAYGLSKFCIGQIMESLGNIGQSINLRLFGVFGPYEDYTTRFISYAIVRSLLNKPIIVNQDAEFDYVYIDDLVRIIKHFLETPAPFISYNVTSGSPIRLTEIAEIVKSVIPTKHPIIVKKRDLKEHYTGSNDRLMDFLPTEFKFAPIEQSIEALSHWYEKQIDLINTKTLII